VGSNEEGEVDLLAQGFGGQGYGTSHWYSQRDAPMDTRGTLGMALGNEVHGGVGKITDITSSLFVLFRFGS